MVLNILCTVYNENSISQYSEKISQYITIRFSCIVTPLICIIFWQYLMWNHLFLLDPIFMDLLYTCTNKFCPLQYFCTASWCLCRWLYTAYKASWLRGGTLCLSCDMWPDRQDGSSKRRQLWLQQDPNANSSGRCESGVPMCTLWHDWDTPER